jgi:hypothetical protein
MGPITFCWLGVQFVTSLKKNSCTVLIKKILPHITELSHPYKTGPHFSSSVFLTGIHLLLVINI